MPRREALLFAVVFSALAAGTPVVTASAAPTGRAAVVDASGNKSSGWNSSRSSTATPRKVDVSALARVGAGNPNAGHLPLLVLDPAAYAAAKNKPKGTAGLAITQPAASSSEGGSALQTATFAHNFTGITSAFEQSNAQNLQEPPDTQVAVGPTWVLEMVNSLGQVYDKTGATYPQATGTFGLYGFFDIAFFSQQFFNNEQFIPTDPRVLYDPSTGRFYASILAYNMSSHDSMVLLGVSYTSDPAGFWAIYPMDFEGPLPNFTPYICDQPKLGYSADKFVLGCSLFDATNTFAGALLILGTKAEGLNAVGMHEAEFGPNTAAFGLVPAQGIDGGTGAAYVAYNLSDNGLGTAATHVVTVTGTPTANNVALADNNVTMNFTHFPPSAPQLGSTSALDTSDDRFMSAVVQGGVLYTSGADGCTPAGDNAVRSCLRLVEIKLASMTLVQGATAGVVGAYLIDPTLGVNSSGDAVFAYSTSSSTTYADIETAIQPAGDPNTFVGGGQLVAGTGPYTGIKVGPTYRWGDYSSVAVDPSAPAYVFVAGEFSNGLSNGTATTWGTQIAELNGHLQVCGAATLTPSVPSPQKPSIAITLTAGATCVTNASPDFQFWIKPPGGTLTMVQDYGNGNTYNWATHVTLGTYTLEVLVRGTTELSQAYDAYTTVSYVISASPCSTPTLTANPASTPQIAGTPVALTASTICADTTALYSFFVQTPDLTWHTIQDYSATNTATWNTFDTQIGSYQLEVQVKNTGSLATYDNYTIIPYAMQLCNAPTLSTGAATSPYASGAGAITLTATGTCAGSTQFQFYYQDAAGVFHLIQAYSGSNTATWNADYTAGAYTLLVEIRPGGSTASYITYLFLPFSLSGCGMPTLTPDKASPQVAGTTVTFTANATCSGTANYQFWVLPPGGVWTKGQDYGPSNTFAWTSPLTVGTYEVEVLVRNSGAAEDAYDNYFRINSYVLGLCNTPTLSTGAASSPYASGSGAITLTATGTCAGSTQFQFYYQDTAGVFHLIQAYSGSNTATWNADYTAGSYSLLVEIRPGGSTASYVTYLFLPFSLSGCGMPTLTSDKASPQAAGTTVTFTANATCSGTANYQFWVLPPGGVWTKAQDGPSNTFAWTSPLTVGTYEVEVLVRNSGAAEDAYDNYFRVAYLIT